MKGWEVKNAMYVENTERCQELTKTNLFRPPYGRIKKSQYKILAKNYKVVFWDVLSYDYDRLTSSKKCLDNSIKYTRNGSIIVFHDNIKAQKNLKFALPQYIEHFLKLNYKFATL
jgi:peptidoglycan/xylan/chitin deacetylase (PgdA/CDA1 family)